MSFLTKRMWLQWPQAATWLTWLLPVFAWAPLTYPGYFELHSGFLPIFNLNDLARHLTDFSWAATVGQPHDLWRGERVLPYLLATLPRMLGVSSVAAVKLVFAASICAGAVGMFGWARRRLGAWPALVASLVYTLLPVGLATIYVRGAFAEALLLGLLPWLLWAADAVAETGSWRSAAGLGLALAAAAWTQAGLALWLAAILVVYVLVVAGRVGRGEAHRAGESRLRAAVPALVGWLGGLVLGALGLLPVVLRHGLGGVPRVSFGEHLVYPFQLLLAGGGAGRAAPGRTIR